MIYGSETPAALDSDKFSEISLDQPVDAEITTAQPQEYNPLQNLDTFSPSSANEQHQQRDENLFNPLAQATAIKDSLSQLPGVLPGVASSVFSSFSSILKGRTSPNPTTTGKDSYTTADPGQLPESQENSSTNQYQCFYDQSIHQQNQDIPTIAPTFYSPTDLQRPEASLSPSSDNQASNLYRLKERRKFYAPIPGLNANQSNPITASPIPPNPIQVIPSASSSPGFNQPPQAAPKPNSSFSLSSFFSGAVDKVLPKQPESTTNVNQEPELDEQPFIYSPPQQETAASVAQFYNPNQYVAPESFQQEPQSIGEHLTQSRQAPFSVSVPPLPSNAVANQPVSAVSNSFNLNPFQRDSTHQQPPPISSTSQIFNVSAPPIATQPVENLTPSPAQFFNPNQFSDPGFQQPKPPSSAENIIQSAESSIIASPLQAPSIVQQPPLATTSASFNFSPFQKPTTPQPPASTSPALVQQSAIPSSYLPPNAVPPSGQGVSYRLKGKPLYKKPAQSTPFANQPANPTTAELFNSTAATSSSNFQIFNPLAFNNSQQHPVEHQLVSSAPISQISLIPPPLSVPVLSSQTQPVALISSGDLPPPSLPVLSAQTQPVPLIVSGDLPPIQTPAAQITSVQFSSQAVTQPESIVPPPVSIFNPLAFISSQQQPTEQQQVASVPTVPVSIFNPLAFINPQQQQRSEQQQITSQLFQHISPIPLRSEPDRSAPILTAQTPPVAPTPSVNLPPVQTQAQILPVQFSSQSVTEPESVGPLPVSNPFIDTLPALDNEIDQLEASPLTFDQDYQATVPPPSITPNNPFQSVPFSVSPVVTQLEQTASVPLNSFFGKDETQSNILQSSVEKPVAAQTPSSNEAFEALVENVTTSISSELPSTAATQLAIHNFFQSTPFDPFQQTQNDFSVDNTIPRSLSDNNANIEQVNTAVESLSLDKENNSIKETVAQPHTETSLFEAVDTSAFDPISFFNNNPTELQDTSNVSEFQIQNFFNEPPPLSEVQENVQEKNFNFIRTNLLNKRIERIANAETASPETLSIASVIAEPASSAQSETSYAEQPVADITDPSLSESLKTIQVNAKFLHEENE